MAANQPPPEITTAAEEEKENSFDKSKVANRSRLIVRLGALLVSHSGLVRKDKIRAFLSYLSRIILLINILLSVFAKDKFSVGSFWGLFICAIFAKFLQYKPVKNESVVIIPSFGVQLETHYWSGRNNKRFIPLEKILKPVLNECVNPVTCYWTLSLILRDENELTLAFQKSRPPLRILVPVWRQLCKATNCEELCNSLDSN